MRGKSRLSPNFWLRAEPRLSAHFRSSRIQALLGSRIESADPQRILEDSSGTAGTEAPRFLQTRMRRGQGSPGPTRRMRRKAMRLMELSRL